MSAPVITILLPTYNRREFLPRALSDLKAQTFQDWICLVINDGGDDVADLVSAAADPRFIYHNRAHLGKSAQLNWAMGQISTKYVGYADDDDEIFPNHVEELYRAAEASGRGFSCSRMTTTVLSPEGCVVGKIPASTEPIVWENVRYCHNLCGIAQLTALHTYELVQRTGLYDEQMRILIDYDFLRRMVRLQEPAMVETVTAHHILRQKRDANGALSSISGLWWRDPTAAGQSLLRFFEKDPEALTRLYLDAGEGLRVSRKLSKLKKNFLIRSLLGMKRLLMRRK